MQLNITVSDSATSNTSQHTSGPFVFDFNVPSNGGEIINVGKTAEAAGISIECEKLIVSPWGIRSVMILNPAEDERGSRAMPIASISFPDGSSVDCCIGRDSITYYECSFFGDFTSQSGTWTLTVSELVYPPVYGGEQLLYNSTNDTNRTAGPWIFRFDVP